MQEVAEYDVVNEDYVDDVKGIEVSVNDAKDIVENMDNEQKGDDKVLEGSTDSKVGINMEDGDNYKSLAHEDGLDSCMNLGHDEHNHRFGLHRQNAALDNCNHVDCQEGKCIKDLKVQLVLHIKNIQALEVAEPLEA